jgi:hypothetical protein
MALDYLSIPGKHCFLWGHNGNSYSIQTSVATSVDVERVFSKGRIFLSHLHSCLSVQSTRALMCVGEWSELGYVKDEDIKTATANPKVEGEEEPVEK